MTQTDTDILWFKDAIIYELHVKAFYDSNGDGIGDMEGLLQKLDYLEDLGVTAIWMLPFYPSPQRDDGYDISDYYSINSNYGDVKTFKKVVAAAHERGMQVITELVINHTSDQHPWFQRARKAPKGSKHRDYYVWTDDPTQYKDARIIFTDYEPSNWQWDPVADAYYWHRFFHHQPDLNFDNPDVQNEIFGIIDYWVEMGVDGFRLDAVPYLFERDGTNCENLPETHVFLKKLRSYVDDKYDGRVMLLAEANMWPEDSVSYFGEGDECHMNYHFPIMPRLFMSLKMEDRHPIIDIIDQTPDIPENCQWAIFLRNHDELTLEMVTDEERDFMYKMYTKDSKAKINVGIRQRLAPLLDNNRQKIELMNMLLFSLPGTPVIYYGDEIGMGDNYYLGDRDGVRTPMQWSPDRNAGFSNANPQKLYLPVIIDPEYKYDSVNVETQRSNASSLFWWMKKMISLRKNFQALSRGTIEFLSPDNPKVLAFIRSHGNERILVVANLSRFSQFAELDLEKFAGAVPIEVFGQNAFPEIGNGYYQLTLSPYGYFWFMLQEQEDSEALKSLPSIELNSFKELSSKGTTKQLETKILPAYFNRINWYKGKNNKRTDLHIKNVIPGESFIMLLVETKFSEALTEQYLLGISFRKGTHDMSSDKKPSIIASATIDGQEGYLIDCSYAQATQDEWYNYLVKDHSITTDTGSMHFDTSMKKIAKKDYSSVLVKETSDNSIVNYADKYILKLYRQVDPAQHPDLEINRYLSQEQHYKNIPEFHGTVSIGDEETRQDVGMLHAFIRTHGSAWSLATDAMKDFYERLMVKLEDEEFEASMKKGKIKESEESWSELIGYTFINNVEMMAERIAEMHMALGKESDNPAFKSENFSLHYQRSLFSPLQSLTRSTLDALKRNIKNIPESQVENAKFLIDRKKDILEMLKQIYAHKFEAKKTRNHGDLHLKNILWNGEDYLFIDFSGEMNRPVNERRLKRSPLRDIAALLRSFHYAAYDALLAYEYSIFDDERLPQWSEEWYEHICDTFLTAYKKHMQSSDLVPLNGDFDYMLNTFLLENMLLELREYARVESEWVAIPLNGISHLLR